MLILWRRLSLHSGKDGACPGAVQLGQGRRGLASPGGLPSGLCVWGPDRQAGVREDVGECSAALVTCGLGGGAGWEPSGVVQLPASPWRPPCLGFSVLWASWTRGGGRLEKQTRHLSKRQVLQVDFSVFSVTTDTAWLNGCSVGQSADEVSSPALPSQYLP